MQCNITAEYVPSQNQLSSGGTATASTMLLERSLPMIAVMLPQLWYWIAHAHPVTLRPDILAFSFGGMRRPKPIDCKASWDGGAWYHQLQGILEGTFAGFL